MGGDTIDFSDADRAIGMLLDVNAAMDNFADRLEDSALAIKVQILRRKVNELQTEMRAIREQVLSAMESASV